MMRGPGPKGPMGPGGKPGMGPGGRPGAKNPKKTFARIFKEVLKSYTPHCIFVLICLFVQVFASVRGMLFTQTLIDVHILPMIGAENPDFTPMAKAIAGIAVIYVIGAFASWLQSYLMIFVTQGTLRNLRLRLYEKMESLPIKYFDTHAHGNIMSVYTNDIDTMRQMISQSLIQMINSAVTIISVLISMIALCVPMTLVTLFMVGVMLTISMKRLMVAGGFFVRQQKALGLIRQHQARSLQGQLCADRRAP